MNSLDICLFASTPRLVVYTYVVHFFRNVCTSTTFRKMVFATLLLDVVVRFEALEFIRFRTYLSGHLLIYNKFSEFLEHQQYFGKKNSFNICAFVLHRELSFAGSWSTNFFFRNSRRSRSFRKIEFYRHFFSMLLSNSAPRPCRLQAYNFFRNP